MARLQAAVSIWLISSLILVSSSGATYSIVARDDRTGEVGAAVASYVAVTGARFIEVVPGHGAVAVQSSSDYRFRLKAVELLRKGVSAQDIASRLLKDSELQSRLKWIQWGIVGLQGPPSTYTGEDVGKPRGGYAGGSFAIQGNGIESEEVIDAMRKAFEAGREDLAGRLLAALEASEKGGGDGRGSWSAAVIVAKPKGAPLVLRADFHATPVAELRRLYREAKSQPPANGAPGGGGLIVLVKNSQQAEFGLLIASSDRLGRGFWAPYELVAEAYYDLYSKIGPPLPLDRLHPLAREFVENNKITDPSTIHFQHLAAKIHWGTRYKITANFNDGEHWVVLLLDGGEPGGTGFSGREMFGLGRAISRLPSSPHLLPKLERVARNLDALGWGFRSALLRVLVQSSFNREMEESNFVDLVVQGEERPFPALLKRLRATRFMVYEPVMPPSFRRVISSLFYRTELPVEDLVEYEGPYEERDHFLDYLNALYGGPIMTGDAMNKANETRYIVSVDKKGKPTQFIRVFDHVLSTDRTKVVKGTQVHLIRCPCEAEPYPETSKK